MDLSQFNKYRQNFTKNLWQSEKWAHLQESLGKKVFFLGDHEAIGLGVIQKMPLGFCYLEIPRGPLGITEKDFWEQVKKITKKHKCIFTRISPTCMVQNMPYLNFEDPKQIHPEYSLILDLSLTEEELLKQMKPKGRYNIRVAQRHKVNVFESKDVSVFYDLLQETTARDNFQTHDLAYYEKFLKAMGNQAKLYLAKVIDDQDNEIIIAGGIFVFMDEVCTYYYGASANKYRNLMAPYLIQWRAISEARKQGMKFYDFLGISPKHLLNHRLKNVTRFKKQFGGEMVSYPKARDVVNRPFLYLLYRLYYFL